MKIGVWGAGDIGKGLAYRLVTTPFTSELHWINRNLAKIERRVVDLEHGLDFAPTCWSVSAHPQEKARIVLRNLDLLILALGAPVPAGKPREDVYVENREMIRESVLPALQEFSGVVLVVTNPVDLIARLVQREAKLPAERVLGLGTVVETARLRASLGSYLSPIRPAREVWAYAVGTHDGNFCPVALAGLGMGVAMKGEEMKAIVESARREVVKAAERVKADQRSTLHPIVEGALKVVETVALDRRAILTPSVLDSETPEGFYYSVPCCLGSSGLIERHLDIVADPEVQAALEKCRHGLRITLRGAGEI